MASSLTSMTRPPLKALNMIPNSEGGGPCEVRLAWWCMGSRGARLTMRTRRVCSTPKDIAEKVSESIKQAEQTCAEDPVAGECAAAWDEVEELSAAASHARDKTKSLDPLDEFCKDNPETDECRIYED